MSHKSYSSAKSLGFKPDLEGRTDAVACQELLLGAGAAGRLQHHLGLPPSLVGNARSIGSSREEPRPPGGDGLVA